MKRTPLKRKGRFHAKDNPTKTYRIKRKPHETALYSQTCRLKRLNNQTKGETVCQSILESMGFEEYRGYHREHIITYGDRFMLLDFFLPDYNLAVEIDGSSHIGKEKFDSQRDAFLEEKGIKTLRFTNTQVFKQSGMIKEKLRNIIASQV